MVTFDQAYVDATVSEHGKWKVIDLYNGFIQYGFHSDLSRWGNFLH